VSAVRIADAGRVNVVIAEDVRGPVTLKLRRVAWDLALCTIVRVQHLAVTVDGDVFLVRRAMPWPAKVQRAAT